MSNIILEIKDNIAIVKLNKKPLNVFDQSFYKEITAFMEALNKRDDFNAVILKSEFKHFCAGGDLPDIKDNNTLGGDFAIEGSQTCARAMRSIINCKKPVIAAVNGKAVGAGTAMAVSCDIIIADEEAEFSVPEITVGYIGAFGFIQLLVPRGLAKYLAFTGKPIKAQEVKAYGGILDVVPNEILFERAFEIARRISRLAPRSVTIFKKSMNDNVDERLYEKYMHEAKLAQDFYQSDDSIEAIVSILERRRPVFTGK